MPIRWNAWSLLRAVQFDYEKEPKERPVRLAAPTAVVGDPVRVGMSGVEIEGRITDTSSPVLRMKVKPTALRAGPIKRFRRA
jgi:hypothetical protein